MACACETISRRHTTRPRRAMAAAAAAASAVASFGSLASGQAVRVFTLSAPSGLSCRFLDYGATLLSCQVPSSGGGDAEEVTLGYKTIEDIVAKSKFMGVTVGRYANRIAGGAFELDEEVREAMRLGIATVLSLCTPCPPSQSSVRWGASHQPSSGATIMPSCHSTPTTPPPHTCEPTHVRRSTRSPSTMGPTRSMAACRGSTRSSGTPSRTMATTAPWGSSSRTCPRTARRGTPGR